MWIVRAGRGLASIVAVVALTTFPEDTAEALRRLADVISAVDLILWIIVAAICGSVLRDVYLIWKEWRQRKRPLPEGKDWEVLSYWGDGGGFPLSLKRFPHTMRNKRTGEIREISYPGTKPVPLDLSGADK